MPRYAFEVTLRGRWERANTLPGEAHTFRRRLYRVALEEDFTANFTMRRRSAGPLAYGPFKATIRVKARSGPIAAIRAAQCLRQVAADLTCRPPKLIVDRSTWRRVVFP